MEAPAEAAADSRMVCGRADVIGLVLSACGLLDCGGKCWSASREEEEDTGVLEGEAEAGAWEEEGADGVWGTAEGCR